MKKTLERFFQRTAFSRDASEFLMLYNSVENESFLLLICCIRTEAELQDLLAEIDYLHELELCPTLLLAEHFVPESLRLKLTDHLDRLEQEADVIRCKEEDFGAELIRLAKERAFFKYLWTGGALKNSRGEVINRSHLRRDVELWSGDSQRELAWAKRFLEAMGQATSLQMVEPHQVLPELFTRHGVGTLVSLGYHFSMLNLAELDRGRLSQLLEDGFNRKLCDDYFGSLAKGTMVLTEADYRGAIVLEPWDDGLHYLDKVVVGSSYFGRGLGSLLLDELTLQFEALTGRFPKLCWRARLDNPYLGRYASLVYELSRRSPMACGTLCDGRYVYHFTGLQESERSAALLRMSQRSSSFKEEPLGFGENL